MATEYEWRVEYLDSDGDVDDFNTFETKEEATRQSGVQTSICLVKFKSNRECDSVDSINYAYLDSQGRMPDTFDDGSKIPIKFKY